MSAARPSRDSVVCVDLDSTLADTRHRRHLCPTVNPDATWDDYVGVCGDDTPIAGTVRLVRMLCEAGYGIHIVTNRPAHVMHHTITWLRRHGIPLDELRMRTDDTHIDDGDILKLHYLADLRSRGYKIMLYIEDRPATAAAMEAQGVPVVCVNPRYTDTPA